MALAELRNSQYQARQSRKDVLLGARNYGLPQTKAKAFDLDAGYPPHRVAEMAMIRVQLQSRRPVAKPKADAANRPEIDRWIRLSIDALMLLSLATVVTSFFIFLTELSAGRAAFLVPSFSAFFVFSVVGLVAFRLKRGMKFIQNGELPT